MGSLIPVYMLLQLTEPDEASLNTITCMRRILGRLSAPQGYKRTLYIHGTALLLQDESLNRCLRMARRIASVYHVTINLQGKRYRC
jgi:hypothetical protein